MVASCNYWDIIRDAVVAKGLIEGSRVPGHAAHFETALVMALRPDWVDADAQASTKDQSDAAGGLDVPLTGAVVTKLDGTARGGMVLALAGELQLPVKLIGVGEQVADLRDFEPSSYVEALF